MNTYKPTDYFIMRIDKFRAGIRLYELSGPYETREKAEKDLSHFSHLSREDMEVWSLPDLQRARNSGIDVDMVGKL